MHAAQQRQGADRLAVGVQLDYQTRLVGQRQQVPGALVELQAGQVADEQALVAPGVVHHVHGERFVRLGVGETVDLVDAHRVTLLGDEQALALGVIS